MRPNRRHGQMTPYRVSLTLQDTPVFVYNVSAMMYSLVYTMPNILYSMPNIFLWKHKFCQNCVHTVDNSPYAILLDCWNGILTAPPQPAAESWTYIDPSNQWSNKY